MKRFFSTKFRRLILVLGILVVCGLTYYFLKGSELKFHPVWTEQDRAQIGEIATSWGKIIDDVEVFSFQDVVKTLKGDADFSEKCGVIMAQIRENRENQKMGLLLYDVIYQTAKSGNASYAGEHDWTLLQLACMLGKKELIVKLLDLGADPNLRAWVPDGDGGNRVGDNALSWVLSGGMETNNYSTKDKLTLLEEFSRHGADLNGDTILCIPLGQYVCVLGKEEAIPLKMIELGADLVSPYTNAQTGNMCSPLTFSVMRKYTTVVRKILEAGADPNETYGEIPLLLRLVSPAMTEESYQIITLLLNYGADANAVMSASHAVNEGEEGRTPLIHLCAHLSSDSVEDIERKKDLIGLMVEKGADVNKAADDGTTALMFVCRYLIRGGAVDQVIAEIARMLLDKGADPKLKDGKGNTAVDYMEEGTPEQRKQVLELLPELEKKS